MKLHSLGHGHVFLPKWTCNNNRQAALLLPRVCDIAQDRAMAVFSHVQHSALSNVAAHQIAMDGIGHNRQHNDAGWANSAAAPISPSCALCFY
jgi:hypothetical protein